MNENGNITLEDVKEFVNQTNVKVYGGERTAMEAIKRDYSAFCLTTCSDSVREGFIDDVFSYECIDSLVNTINNAGITEGAVVSYRENSEIYVITDNFRYWRDHIYIPLADLINEGKEENVTEFDEENEVEPETNPVVVRDVQSNDDFNVDSALSKIKACNVLIYRRDQYDRNDVLSELADIVNTYIDEDSDTYDSTDFARIADFCKAIQADDVVRVNDKFMHFVFTDMNEPGLHKDDRKEGLQFYTIIHNF